MFKNLLTTIFCMLAMVTVSSAETYYWVGGSGNWSDISHWATTSGGDVFYEVIPGAMDDVIFDQGSFLTNDATVTIDVASATCRNMIWTNATNLPTIDNLPSSSLLIHGDLTLKPQMNFAFNGTLSFRGEGNHTISTFGQNLGADVYFDDVNGVWLVDAPMRLTNRLFIRKGSVQFDDIIECNYLHIIPTSMEDNCNVSINGDVIIRANNTRSGSDPFESMKVNVDLVNLNTDPNIQILFLGTNTTLRLVGVDRSIALPSINFSNNSGNQRVLADDGLIHHFGEIHFGANGRIDRSADIDLLSLNGGSSYTFGANYDFNIDNWVADGNCSNPIYLFSTSIGSRARFATPTALTGSFLNIRDIEVTGGNFQINNAKNLGNTAGWNMTDLGSQDLFWVGGNGIWQDQANWSYTSGGAGGACIPTPIDDVFFDENSFDSPGQSVVLSGTFSYCRNMTWSNVTNNPSWNFDSRTINISGSLTLVADMAVNADGVLRFNAFQSNHTITTAGHDLGGDVRIETRGGVYTLMDDLTISGRLLHIYGGIVSNGHTLNLVEYASNYGTARSLDISNSQVNLAAITGKGAAWQIGSNGYTLLADNSTINATSAISLIHRGSGTLQFDRILFASTGNIYAYNDVDARFRYVSMARSSFVFEDNHFDTLVLAPSQSYQFSSGSIQSIGRLESMGSCEEPINIRAQTVGEEAIFFTDLDDSDIRSTMVKDIHVQGNGVLNNILGIDNGNTDGWVIPTDMSRDLFWVGNGGNWNDPIHWSLSSNGPGGECIPTSVDNVFFDNNSFNQNNQIVTGGNIFFHNMSWEGVTNTPAVSFTKAFTHGSILLVDDMDINAWTWISLLGDTENRILDTRGKAFTHLELNALGDWTLGSPINATGQFFLYNGGLSTNDQSIRTERIRIWERNNLNINLSTSTIDLFGDGASTPQFAQYQSDEARLDFDPGTSTINIEHPNGYTLIGSGEVSLHNLNFQSGTGRGYMDVRTAERIQYNKVIFNSDGLILREHMMDSLIFTPGKTYTLHSGRTQIVNDYFEMMGSPCGPTTLKATSVGVPSTIQKTNGDVISDYISMRDQIGLGNSFNAGQHSTNVGNSNEGWIFEEINDENPERGILGADQILCDDSSIVLNPYSNTQNLTYEWSDGSTDRSHILSTPGTYWVDLTFGANCQLRDSIEIGPQVYSNTELGEDMTLCEGTIDTLDVTIDGGTYRWQDDSELGTFVVSAAGQYYVSVEYLGCPNSDTITVAYDPIPEPNLGIDRLACKDETISLNPNTSYESIMWSDNSTTDVFSLTEPGTYWVEVTEGVCSKRDSIVITYFDVEGYLGPDTSMCMGDKIKLEYTDDGSASYEWSNGSNQSSIEVREGGIYSLRLTRGTCELTDEIEVIEKPLPELSIESELAVCAGESIYLAPTSNGDAFEWSTGEMAKDISVSEEGTYQVIAFLDDCPNNDYVTVFVDERPEVDLGPDTTICEQQPIFLDVSFTGADYTWNDESSTAYKTVNTSGYYAVTITNGACVVEDEITVVANECKEFRVYAPNIFSPDGDGQNDEFLPFFDQSLEVSEYQLRIFDRWGGVVFETNNLEDGWDGTLSGTKLQRGNYIYTMQFSYRDELTTDKTTVSGDVFLAR